MRSGPRFTKLNSFHKNSLVQQRFFGELPFITKSIIRDILDGKRDHHGNMLDKNGRIVRPELSQDVLLNSAKHASGHAIVSHLMELKEISKQLGSNEEAIKFMKKKYPGIFNTATEEEIRKNHEVLTEAAKNNPGGYF